MLALNDYLVPLNLSLKEFAQRMIQKENSDISPGHPFSMKLFELLVEGGCDFYELLSIYSEIPKFENNEIDELMILSPAPKERYTVTRNNIRTCIPRWTSSKYSSGPISEVVESIIDSLTDFTPRVRVFNSNLNLRNKRAVNDRYILMISEKNALFMDINRRSTYCQKRCFPLTRTEKRLYTKAVLRNGEKAILTPSIQGWQTSTRRTS